LTDNAAYDYADEWPDEAPLKVLRLNPFYRRLVAGLSRDYANTYFFNGTDEQQREMVEKMLVCAAQIELDYECPENGGSMRNVIQVGYVIPATEQGDAIAVNTWTQCPYNIVLGDTSGQADLQGDGTVVVPAGNWLLTIAHCMYASTSNTAFYVRCDDGSTVQQGPRHSGTYSTHVHISVPVLSDGSTPIAIEFFQTAGHANGFGVNSLNSSDILQGTATFTELPS
jgi:hypothetical protein